MSFTSIVASIIKIDGTVEPDAYKVKFEGAAK